MPFGCFLSHLMLLSFWYSYYFALLFICSRINEGKLKKTPTNENHFFFEFS